MYRRPYRKAVAVASMAVLTAGCVQATRHSNTMYFGTNTTFGIKAGAATGETPKVIVGYDRQEAVILPLVANTADDSVAPSNRLKPCDLNSEVAADPDKYAVHPCSLVAINGSAMDSYSVLASFGANFDGSVDGAGAGTKGGLAQYFATGIAAQILAFTGGASVVATSKAAEESAKNAPSAADVSALFSNPDAFTRGRARAVEINSAMSTLKQNVKGETVVETLQRKIKKFEEKLGRSVGLEAACASSTACLTKIEQLQSDFEFSENAAFIEAVNGWSEY